MNLTSSHYTSYRYVGGHFNTVTFSQTILGNAILKAQYYKSVTLSGQCVHLAESTAGEKSFQVRPMVARLHRGELWGPPMCLYHGALERHFTWA